MAIITLPATTRFLRKIEWSLDRPAQVNRSAYTGRRQVVANPWHGKWSASCEFVPIIGEANVRALRAFFAQLKGQINTFLLPATEGVQVVAGTAPVAITNDSNTTVTSLGSGVYRVSKSGGTTSLHDADAISAVTSGDFTLKVTPGASTAESMFGVNSDPPGAGYTPIDYAMQLASGGTRVFIFESGTNIGDFGAYAGQPLWVKRTGSTLTYEIGALGSTTVLRTVTTSASLGFDCSLFTSGAVADVILTIPSSGSAASGASQGATSITLVTVPTGLAAGMLATVTLPSGNMQMVLLTQVSGSVTTFEPPLREAISTGAAVETSNPVCQVALADSSFGYSVDPGKIYGMAMKVEEAF